MLAVIDGELTRRDIMDRLDLRDINHFREEYQQIAVSAGLIEMTIPDKPNSRLQKYRLTQKGKDVLRALSQQGRNK
jgi:ATP-dependent DNA helicase RecG